MTHRTWTPLDPESLLPGDLVRFTWSNPPSGVSFYLILKPSYQLCDVYYWVFNLKNKTIEVISVWGIGDMWTRLTPRLPLVL